METKFGDFEELKEETEVKEEEQDETQPRIKLPNKKNNEIIGIVIQRLGGNRMEVKTTDGKTRNCRVPGRFKRRFWLRQGDIVIITPWEHDDSKGDIIYQYKKTLMHQLKTRGLLQNLNEEF